MKRGWKSLLSLLLCIALAGSNAAIVQAADTTDSAREDVVAEIGDTTTEENETTTENSVTSDETTNDSLSEDATENSTNNITDEGSAADESVVDESIVDESTVDESLSRTSKSADETDSEEENVTPATGPVVSAEMPDVETLAAVALDTTYTASYNPKEPYNDSIWMTFTPEITGVYLVSYSCGNDNSDTGSADFFDESGDYYYSDYTYCDAGLLQYLTAGTTYVLKLNGAYRGSGTINFSVTKAKDISSLEIKSPPTQTTYYENFGETLDNTGMKIRVNYTDGTYETVTADGNYHYELKSNYTLEIEGSYSDDYFEVKISNFDSIESVKYEVTLVTPSSLTKYTSGNSITFKKNESVKYYKFVPSSTGKYKVEATGITNIYAYIYDPSTGYTTTSLTKGSTYYLRVENLTKTAGTARVYITTSTTKTLKSYKITQQPYQTEYYYKEGDSLNIIPSGLQLKLTYSDNSTETVTFTDRARAWAKDVDLRFDITNAYISNPTEGEHTLTVTPNGYNDMTVTFTVTLKPYSETVENSLQEGTNTLTLDTHKPYYFSYTVPEDGVYALEYAIATDDYYGTNDEITILGYDSWFWNGNTAELTAGSVIYFYVLGYDAGTTFDYNIYIDRLHDTDATITDFQWTTEPEKDVLGYYTVVRGEGIVTYSDGSTAVAGITPYCPVVDKPRYPVEIEYEFGSNYTTLGNQAVSYYIYDQTLDKEIEIDERTMNVVGPGTYNNGPIATIKTGQTVTINAAALNDDFAIYKFIPTKTSAYRMVAGTHDLTGTHEYGIFTEIDGKITCVDSTNASGFYVDREILTKDQTYYVVFPVGSSDNFTFTCVENKAVQAVTTGTVKSLYQAGSTMKDVLSTITLTIYYKDGTSEKLNSANWTYYEGEDSTGYYNTDSYGNVYTSDLGVTQSGSNKLSATPQMISICQEYNYTNEVQLGYITANGYKVTFNKNGGSTASKSSVLIAKGSKLGTLPTAGRKGYTLKGWYTAKTGGTKVTSTRIISKNQTLYAQWTKVTKPAKAKKATLKNLSGKKLKVTYKKTSYAKGYQIVYSTSSKFTSSTTKKVTTTSLTKTLTGMKKGKTYYVKVRAYKVDSLGNKIYGNYSTVSKLKITK